MSSRLPSKINSQTLTVVSREIGKLMFQRDALSAALSTPFISRTFSSTSPYSSSMVGPLPLSTGRPATYTSHLNSSLTANAGQRHQDRGYHKEEKRDKEEKRNFDKEEREKIEAMLKTDLSITIEDEDINNLVDNLNRQFTQVLSATNPSAVKLSMSFSEYVRNFNLTDVMLKSLEVILPKQNHKLSEAEVALRKEIADTAHENYQKNPESTYIFLVSLINSHLLKNNYPVPPEIGKQIIVNLKNAGNEEKSGTSLHFNETYIFGKNAINKAVKEGKFDATSVIGSILNVAGGMLTAGSESALRKIGAPKRTATSVTQERLDFLGSLYLRKSQDLLQTSEHGKKMKSGQALAAFLGVQQALVPEGRRADLSIKGNKPF